MTPQRSPAAVAGVVFIAWLIAMEHGDRWGLLSEYAFMSLTMAAGSFIAGATSEGGGAVAFPVMTLVFAIPPATARDFSLMIQSVGMTAAALTIFHRRIPIALPAVIWGGLGGGVGQLVGRALLSPLLPPGHIKLVFTSLWLSFAAALWLINRDRSRAIQATIGPAPHRIPLLGVGLLGGMVSGLTGSGLDILVFAWLVLARRLSESIATPTSVVLMASNSLVACGAAALAGPPMAAEAWSYWWVCVPVVVVGAPMGAVFIAGRRREQVVGFLCASILVQFLAALVLVPQSWETAALIAAVLAGGLTLFWWMARSGATARPGPDLPRRCGPDGSSVGAR